MSTIDVRSRFIGDAQPLAPSWLHEGLPDVLREAGALGARGVAVLDLTPLGFEVDGTVGHLTVEGDRLVVHEGAGDGAVVALDAAAFSELMQDVTSSFGLVMAGRIQMVRGTADQFIAWEPVLRAVLDERPVYESGSVRFTTRDGGALDLQQSFRIDDSRDDIGHFLAQAGFLHFEDVFTEDEMAAVSADLDAAAAAAERDDGASWWARNDDGWYPSRILGFNRKSSTLQELMASDRFRVIGQLTDDAMVQRTEVEDDSAEGLWKKVGVVDGISDVSWHKDCTMGGHSRRCCGLTTGISITGADKESGELGVVAGSHRANTQGTGLHRGFDLPRIPLPTRTGDVTVHCSCTHHMSRPPVSRERRVAYTGFTLAPRAGDAAPECDPEITRRDRHALNEQARQLQRRDDFGREHDTFALDAS